MLGQAARALLVISFLSQPSLAQTVPGPIREPAQTTSSKASDEPPDERQAAAEGLYRRGVRAYQRAHYKQAIEAFAEADALVPSAALSFNSALAYEKLSDTAQALRCYRDYMRRAPNADNTSRVATRIRELEAQLATRGVQQITVLSTPDGAKATVDGKAVGVTPATLELTPGRHELNLTLEGYSPLQAPLFVTADHASDARFTLLGSKARVSAEEKPSNEGASDAQARSTEKKTPATAQAQRSPWPWVVLGAGGAALLGAGGFELARRSAESDARRESTQTGYADALDRVDARRSTALVLLGVGGALTLTSGALWILESNSKRDAAPVAQVGFDGRQVVLRYGGKL